MTRIARCLLLVAVMTALVSSSTSAQVTNTRPARVPVTIALLDKLPQDDVPFVIQRRPDQAPYDLILLRSDATSEHLSDAIRTLMAVRQVQGDTTDQRATMRLRPRPGGRSASPRQFPWVVRLLGDLRAAEPREVAGIGVARSVVIWLPPQRLRSKQGGV